MSSRHAIASGRWIRFLDALLPCGCAVCGTAVPSAEEPVCPLCAARIHPVPEPRCPRCGLTRVLPGPSLLECSECCAWPEVLPRTASSCLHRGAAAELVRGLKYRGWTALVGPMADLMLPAARRVADRASPVLVPVPLTRSRRRERGFNQAELLARGLSRLTAWPVDHLLVRTGGGPPLARLGRRARQAAVREAFAPDARRCLSYRSVWGATPALLVDDVITTGSTVAACAEALSMAGVECAGAVSFARTSGVDMTV